MATAEHSYRERPSRLPGATVWTRTHPLDTGPHRILPDGCIDLIWRDGELLVAGPDTTAYVSRTPAGARFAAVRFAPGTAPGVLGVPADEVRDSRVPLAALWPGAQVRRLAERVGDAPDPAGALEEALLDRWQPPEPWVGAVVERLRGGAAVDATAAEVSLSERQLLRRCQRLFGYGPKTLLRILRLGRALELARTGTALGEVAARIGYADQAHLSREVRALAGAPLTGLLAPAGPSGPTALSRRRSAPHTG